MKLLRFSAVPSLKRRAVHVFYFLFKIEFGILLFGVALPAEFRTAILYHVARRVSNMVAAGTMTGLALDACHFRSQVIIDEPAILLKSRDMTLHARRQVLLAGFLQTVDCLGMPCRLITGADVTVTGFALRRSNVGSRFFGIHQWDIQHQQQYRDTENILKSHKILLALPSLLFLDRISSLLPSLYRGVFKDLHVFIAEPDQLGRHVGAVGFTGTTVAVGDDQLIFRQ